MFRLIIYVYYCVEDITFQRKMFIIENILQYKQYSIQNVDIIWNASKIKKI